MIGFLKTIFAGPKEAAKLVDAGIKGIDASFWTAEEKSAWVLKWMIGTNAQNLARRGLAFAVAFEWLLAMNVWIVLKITEHSASDAIGEALTPTGAIGAQMALIMAFYFAAHVLRAKNGK